jgi:NRPS condensation-like uncharacterized protein
MASSFWPVFGEYEAGIIHFDTYSEADCFEEEVTHQQFNPEESPVHFHERYCRAVPSSLKKLFFLKIIQYKNGTVLIPKMNHLAGDGYSYFYFLSALAALYRENDDPSKQRVTSRLLKPHHQRTLLKEFQYQDIEMLPIEEEESLTIEFKYIKRTAVRSMIKDIASNFGQTVSANDILSAMVIQKTAEMQPERFGNDIRLSIPIDIRTQIKEYGPKFFGNGLMFYETRFTIKDIEQLALAIRKGMPAVNKESYLQYLNQLETAIAGRQTEKLRPYDPEKGCLVTNLSQLPVTKLNFGTGNPDFIVPLTIGKNSAAILGDKETYILRLAY